MIEESQHIY